MNVNTDHIKYFLDAAEEQSVTRAAEKNHVTHSTVSQGIKRLEESIGVELLVHRKRSFLLTQEAKHLFSSFQSVIQSLRNLEISLENMNHEPSGEISLASSQSILAGLLLNQYSIFQKRYKNISLNFEIGRTQEIVNLVKSRKVEFGITIDDNSFSGVDKKNISTGNFILISKSKTCNLMNCKGFVITRSRPETQELMYTYENKFKKSFPLLHEVDSWNLIKEVVKNGSGVGLIPDFALQKTDRLNIVKYTAIPYKLVAVSRKSEALSKVAQVFIDQLKVKTY